MKGVIFNLLEAVAQREMGEEGWDAVLEQAGLSGAYTALGSYSDAEFSSLVRAMATRRGAVPTETLRWFGFQAMPLLADRYGVFFEQAGSVRRFLKNLNDIIHPQVRQLYSGAVCPHFEYEEREPDTLVLVYSSPRRLCALALGFIDGLAEHFGEPVTVSHPQCMLHGASACRIVVA